MLTLVGLAVCERLWNRRSQGLGMVWDQRFRIDSRLCGSRTCNSGTLLPSSALRDRLNSCVTFVTDNSTVRRVTMGDGKQTRGRRRNRQCGADAEMGQVLDTVMGASASRHFYTAGLS